jgi:hypothetical protein
MEEHLNFQEMEDDINFLGYGRQPLFFFFRKWKTTSSFQKIENDLSFQKMEVHLNSISAEAKYFLDIIY